MATKKAKTKPKKDGGMEQVKRELLKRKQILLSDAKKEMAKHFNGEFKEGADKAEEDGVGGVDITEEVSWGLLGSKAKVLNSINEALRKIELNTYGICEECEEPINKQRLIANPSASLCISCQEEREKEERLYN